ncbi:MAG: hypothetical protein HC926_02445 [Synechococcaceae cyanobacterium SM2_3_60]|nr:hypothetical protein [Synechococcaceae cyanobacterium SM2_3_60]
MDRRWCRQLTRLCLEGCTAVTVRDHGSAALLDQWQITYTYAPDPVWAIAPHTAANPRRSDCGNLPASH